MFRLICCSSFFRFTTATANTTKYIIKNSSYLIPAPPKRPINGYSLFVKEEYAGNKNLKDIVKVAPVMAKKWKTYPEYQEKFNKLAETHNEGYQQLKKNYEEKFLIPFKRITGHNLRLKKLFDDKKIVIKKGQGIQGISRQVTKAFKQTRTIAEDQALKTQAKKISDERKNIISKFQFPKPEFKSFASFKIKHRLPVEERGPTYEADLQAKYKASVDHWKGEVKKFLEGGKFEMTADQFVKLYEKDLKQKEKKKFESSF